MGILCVTVSTPRCKGVRLVLVMVASTLMQPFSHVFVDSVMFSLEPDVTFHMHGHRVCSLIQSVVVRICHPSFRYGRGPSVS
jgi:hypothetical protein